MKWLEKFTLSYSVVSMGNCGYVFPLIYSKNCWNNTFRSWRLLVFLLHTGANFVTKKFGIQFKILHLVSRRRKGRRKGEKEERLIVWQILIVFKLFNGSDEI